MSAVAPVDAWRLLIEALPDGAALVDAQDPDMPLLYVNPAFERLTGYTSAELLGRNLRLLQGPAGSQAGVRRLRDAIEAGVETRALVQNFRKSGESFWMEVRLVPVRDAGGTLTHWASLHREAEARGGGDERGGPAFHAMAPTLLPRQDALTGLRSPDSFEELLQDRLATAQRERGTLTLFLIQVDDFGRYVETFDRAAGDALVKRVARALGTCFRRASDVLARRDEDSFAVLATGMATAQMQAHAQSVCRRLGDLRIHHPRSNYRRYVTLSVAAVGGEPPAGATVQNLLDQARELLEQARAEGDTARVGELTRDS
jgi:diguanylate cyclase (GGDEF)-like protein/PAS domain S-box-containing protein